MSIEGGFFVILKRLFDIVLSLIGFTIFLPTLLILAIWIKWESRGPIFYRGERVGKNGKSFKMFKFRTMVVNADKIGGPSTADDDPRITRSGRFIRKYKLDELAQLISVLKGDMSFVGPRPEVKFYTGMFNEDERRILSVRPGITDWASLANPDEGSVLAGHEDPEKAYMELIRPLKLKLQLKYVREHTFLKDLRILFLTAKSVILRKMVFNGENFLTNGRYE